MSRTYTPSLSTSLLLLSILFSISIFVRWPHLNRPLSANYEWVTAHTLVTLQIWNVEGIFAHRFNPIYTFPNANDHHIKCPISGVSDHAGNYYYVSYPPFAFILPHVTFQTLGIYPTVPAIQTFNLALHLLCCILLFLILIHLTSSSESKTTWPALVGASIYMFSPLNLWHHANVYFADILVQLLFILDIYLLLRIFSAPSKNLKSSLAAIFVALFLTMYTEWLGFLLAFVVFLYALAQLKKHPAAKPLAITCILCTLTVIALILIQYSSISGFDDFIDIAKNRYLERSGQSGRNQFYNLDSYAYLGNLYLRNYFPIMVIIAILLVLQFSLKTKLTYDRLGFVTLIALLPPLLHHLILLEFTLVHDLALVKTSVFFSILIGILFHNIARATTSPSFQVTRSFSYFVVISMLGLSVYLYHGHVITPENFSLKELGQTIKDNSSPEDTIFFKTTRTLGDFLIQAPVNFVIAPQIQYYSGRCIQVVPSLDEARAHLRTYNKKKGKVFTIENMNYAVEEIVSVSSEDSTDALSR